MRWFEYKAEVDGLHASEELKAKLLALQAAQSAGAAPPASPQKKPPVRFPWKRAASLAACFVLGAGVCGAAVLGATGGLFRAGSASSPSMEAAYAMDMAGGAENGWASAKLYDGVAAAAGEAQTASLSTGAVEEGVKRSSASTAERKIIYTARLYLESKSYDETRAALDAAVQELGGYIEACDEYSGSDDARSVVLTLRIPAENYQRFLSDAAGAGNLRSKSEQAEDITSQYIDVAARLANLEAQRSRLQELEAQAETLSDLLEIESKLSDVQYQLESWQSQMAWYDDQVDFCTVTVELAEVKEYTPVRRSFGERIGGALSDGWTSFVEGLQDMAVWLAFVWPVAVLLAAAAAGGVWWYRRRRKKKL